MSFTSFAGGFFPLRYLNGAPWNGQCRKYIVPAGDSTALFVGDLVKMETSGDSATGLPTVTQATATGAVVGAVIGFEPVTTTFDSGSSTGHGAVSLDVPLYRAASTRRIVLVADDPNLLFYAEEDQAGTPLTAAMVQSNADIIVAAGSTLTGASGMQIDSSTQTTTATLPLRIMSLLQQENNNIYTSALNSSSTIYRKTLWVVKINNHQLASGTGVAGLA